MVAEQLISVVDTAQLITTPREWVGTAAVVVGATLTVLLGARRLLIRSAVNRSAGHAPGQSPGQSPPDSFRGVARRPLR
ncbi:MULTISPECIES: hypothetical protein [unclassified Actinopolyspora]|uniref:hypothetical protein n=1 Tax=unclassified Actinopolyspora TaxID=2639451 RepID=UPI0013F68007|nr:MULTISPECIES: hypothetical protein [unclassified Actinopolyspora]NHD15569.1 hypothetical protein [Actinopolyspora sp. BKK2]NHE75218.1 hypothetical protein [Actinopolyspora sp. BKK1]